MSRFSQLLMTLRRFRHDRAANVAMMFAIAAIPVLGAVGGAVDYGVAVRARSKLQAVADEAALVAVSKTNITASAANAKAAALAFFNAQSTQLGLTASTVSVDVTDATQGRTAVVSFTGSTPTSFMTVLGYNTLSFGASSTAKIALPVYIDFYLLLDNTPSMGIGATAADITNLQSLTAGGEEGTCAFACHNIYKPSSHTTLDPTGNYYYIAKNNGVTMRIDVVRQATQSLMDTATNVEVVSNQFRMAVYTFGAACDSPTVGGSLSTIQTLTSSLSTAKTAAGNIDLMTIPYQNYYNDQCTNFDSVFGALNTAMPTPGSGTSASPQEFVFFVSDGTADENNAGCNKTIFTGGGYNRCQEPLDPALCTTLKSRGIQIAVLYTTFEPIPGNSWYTNWIAPFNQGPFGPSPNSEIAQNMQSCASPGYYFEVSPTQGISDAMNALFVKAVEQARLTQ